MIRRQPTPGTRAIAALNDPLLINLANDIAITGEQRLRRAHLGTHRQLPLTEAVRAVLCEFLGAARRFGAATAGAVGAFVHLAARTEIADLRILGRAKRTGVEAIAAPYALVLVVQYDSVFSGIDA